MDADDVTELFRDFGPVTVRRMFGGAGIFVDDLMIGLVFDGEIYLKADDVTLARFEHEGSTPFVYPRAKSPEKAGRASRHHWRMPTRLYDDPEELAVWARDALAAAQRLQAVKQKAPKRSASKKKPAAKPASGTAAKKKVRR